MKKETLKNKTTESDSYISDSITFTALTTTTKHTRTGTLDLYHTYKDLQYNILSHTYLYYTHERYWLHPKTLIVVVYTVGRQNQ